jgi:hypothetical protein
MRKQIARVGLAVAVTALGLLFIPTATAEPPPAGGCPHSAPVWDGNSCVPYHNDHPCPPRLPGGGCFICCGS